jgi:uncharacterized NAD-dependent epimerase/dehydratase family protein
MARRIVLLTEGSSNPHLGKTAAGILRYCPEEVVAVLDSMAGAQSVAECFHVDCDVPFISRLEQADRPDTLTIGIAPPGGMLPADWRPIITEALRRGMRVVSGLHHFISEDEGYLAAAAEGGGQIEDVRKNGFRQIARFAPLRPGNLRIHTVGHDCSCGKMTAALELTHGLRAKGVDAVFAATGQTGIMIDGSGLPVDCIVADFVNGAAEQLVAERQAAEITLVEGQGSLVHPSYSAVTLGLLHGARPQALVFCFHAGRVQVGGLQHVTIPALDRIKRLYEECGSIYAPCPVIAAAMNSRGRTTAEARDDARRAEDLLQVPVTDPIRDGRDRLVELALDFYRQGSWRGR